MKNLRINIILTIILILCGTVLARLFYLQIEQGDKYKALAKGQQSIVQEVTGRRGDIYFSEAKKLLALTDEEPYLYLSPEEIEDGKEDEIAMLLEEIVGVEKEEIKEKSIVSGSYYQIIKKKLSDEEVDKIKDLNYSGIYIGNELKRYYPGKDLAAQVSGFINQEGEGQYGLESYYNDILSGKEKVVKTSFNPWGFLTSSTEDNQNGADLYLTIDYNIQFVAEGLIDEAIEEYGASSGTIVVMDPFSGAILAIAQSPRFNLNAFNEVSDYQIYQGNATQMLFEPGSIFKPITMSAALNEGIVTPDSVFDDKYGCKVYTDYTVCNYNDKAWGESTMTQILERSMNTGVIYVEEQLGHKLFMDYVRDFGFMEDSGIDLPSIYSRNKNLQEALDYKIEVTFGNASFGQGLMLTPVHMVKAFSAIANGGNLFKPYVVSKIIGEEEIDVEPEILKEDVISAKTSSEVTKMLVNVVENGYGKRAKIEGYYIAGKTGTSQIPYSSLGENKSGYSDETWQSFIGYAPAYNPKFVALVKLDSPTNSTTSEYSAAPVFRELAKYILDYYKVPFDYDPDEEVTND